MKTTAEMLAAFTTNANAVGLNVLCGMSGELSSQIAIVSEAPGRTETATGLPMSGEAGSFLWANLRKYGITRNSCYVTNVIKKPLVGDGDEKKQTLSKAELDHWRALLRWELLNLPNLQIVFALGNHALTALTGHDGIVHWRGSVLDVTLSARGVSRDIKVVCGFNPAFPLREPKNEVVFAFDCHKLARVQQGKFRPYRITEHINPTVRTAVDFLRHIGSVDKPIATDVESIGGETACIGFANDPHEGMCISFRTVEDHVYSVEDEATIRKEIQRLYRNPSVKFVGQNGMFDMTWLWYKDKLRIRKFWFDTMLAHHTLYPQLPHNLGFICTQYTDHPYYKDEKSDWKEGGTIDDFWRYNVKDCCITLASGNAMFKELFDQKLDKFFFDHVMRAQAHLSRMTVGGIKIDMELKERLSVELTAKTGELLQQFHAAAQAVTGADAEYTPNPNSPAQMSDLYFNRMKLVGRGSKTDKLNRDTMYSHPRTTDEARNVLRLVNEYAKERKFLSTYVNAKADEDGRMRCEWKQTGVQAAPGRLSSAAVWWDTGMNFQNQTGKSQQMFVADEGYCFVYFDLSQAEARYVGWDANIVAWMHQFEQARIDGKFDCHRALAADMFGVPYDEVPTKDRDSNDNPTIRFIAKRCRHGLNYRMAADRLSQTTGLSRSDANEAYNKYHRLTPELRKWWADLEQEVRKTHMLFNAYGRRFYVMERITPEALESIVAFKPQSTIGDKVTRAIYKIHDDPRWPDSARVCLNVHDALIAMCRIEHGKRCLKIMREYAEEPIMVRGNQLIIPMEPGMSVPDEHGVHRWSTIKKMNREEIL